MPSTTAGWVLSCVGDVRTARRATVLDVIVGMPYLEVWKRKEGRGKGGRVT